MLISTWYQNITARQNSIPTFVDLDGDGRYDLFMGTSEGRIEFYRNDGTPTTAHFVRVTNSYANTAPLQEASPVFIDIDGDGDADLLMGRAGIQILPSGMYFYRLLTGGFVQTKKALTYEVASLVWLKTSARILTLFSKSTTDHSIWTTCWVFRAFPLHEENPHPAY